LLAVVAGGRGFGQLIRIAYPRYTSVLHGHGISQGEFSVGREYFAVYVSRSRIVHGISFRAFILLPQRVKFNLLIVSSSFILGKRYAYT
jgi:hypothetical protein